MNTLTAARTISILAAAGLAVGVVFERRASAGFHQQIRNIRQQLNRMDDVVAENRRLSNLVAVVNAPSKQSDSGVESSAANAQESELTRLRSEVESLRRQSKEIEALRADTRQVRSAQQPDRRAASQTANSFNANGAQLEILKADYWTPKTNLDVADELRDRVRSGNLKAIASNNLKGDPDVGTVKRLTIVYRFGGVTMTNEFNENDFIVLPPTQ